MTLDVCVRALSAPAAAVIEEMTYTITPVSVNVQAGIVVGEITGMRVVERVAKSTGGTVSPARLTGTLTLTNTSASQSVRLVAGKIQYLDDQWQPIELEGSRAAGGGASRGRGVSRRGAQGQEAQGTPAEDRLHSVAL